MNFLPLTASPARRWGCVAAILAFAFCRFIFLDADPGVLKAIGDIGDEGFWSQGARNLALYGTLVISDQSSTDEFIQTAVSPANTGLLYPFFKFAGVSLYVSRLPTALLCLFSIGLLYFLLRKYDETMALAASLILALDNQYFIFSRIGHVEAKVGFFLLLAFYFLMVSKRPLAAGIAFGVSAATKLTALMFGPVFCLFFVLQIIRKEMTIKEVVRFAAGSGMIGAALAFFMFHNYDLFSATYKMQASAGLELVDRPHRLLSELVMGLFFAHPTTMLLLLIAGVYLERIRVWSLLGNNAKQYLRELHSVDVLLISWLVGYVIALILVWEGSYRRMNLFSIPLVVAVARLLTLRREKETHRGLSLFEFLLCLAPLWAMVTLASKKFFQPFFGQNCVFISGLLSLAGAGVLAAGYPRLSDSVKNKVNWLARGGWVVLVSASFAYYLRRLLPDLGVAPPALPAAVAACAAIGAAGIFFWLSRAQVKTAFIGLALINAGLDAAALVRPSFTQRDVSREIGRVAGDDYVVNADELSLDARFHPISWGPADSPTCGPLNDRFVAAVKPKYLVMPSAYLKEENNPMELSGLTCYVDGDELRAIGVQEARLIRIYPLYPARGGYRHGYHFYDLIYGLKTRRN